MNKCEGRYEQRGVLGSYCVSSWTVEDGDRLSEWPWMGDFCVLLADLVEC